jgi:hypothetical protein
MLKIFFLPVILPVLRETGGPISRRTAERRPIFFFPGIFPVIRKIAGQFLDTARRFTVRFKPSETDDDSG